MQGSEHTVSDSSHPPPLQHTSIPAGSFTAPNPHYSASYPHSNEALSLKALTQRFYTWFKDSGMLAALQTQFRAQIIQQIPRRHLIQTQAQINSESAQDMLRLGKKAHENTLMQRVVNSLIVEYFVEFDYPFALSIFGPESGTRSEAQSGKLTTDDILSVLRLDDKRGSAHADYIIRRINEALSGTSDEDKENSNASNRISIAGVREGYDSHNVSVSKRITKKPSWTKRSLLAILLDAVASAPPKVATFDSICQTDPESHENRSIDYKLKSIDEEYLDKHLQERELLFPTLQEKMLKFEREQNEKFQRDLEMEKKRFQENELSRMKLEERQRYRAEEEKLRKELRKEHDTVLLRLRKESEEMMTKYQAKERELQDQLFRERQSLQENMNIVHNREVELSRKRELMEKTQLLAEQKIRESDRLLTSRSTEVEYLASNLAKKIQDETSRVRNEYQAQIEKRDEIIERLTSQTKNFTEKLDRKSTDLESALKLNGDFESEIHRISETRKTLEINLAGLEHTNSISQARINELESRRATLEEAVLQATAREQVCVLHQAEIENLRKKNERLQEEMDVQVKSLREKHGVEISQETSQAQLALQQAHSQTTQIVAQWKSSYGELLAELEKARDSDEKLKQQLEEEALVNRELKREVAALRSGVVRQGGGYHIAALPAAVPSASPYIPASLSNSLPAQRGEALLPLYPPLQTGILSDYARASSVAGAQQVREEKEAPSVVTDIPDSVAAHAASLDNEFFSRQTSLENESSALSHALNVHAARQSVSVSSEKKEQLRKEAIEQGAKRAAEIIAAAKEYEQQSAPDALATSAASHISPLPSAIESTPSESYFLAKAKEDQKKRAAEEAAFLQKVREEESAARIKAAADEVEARQKRETAIREAAAAEAARAEAEAQSRAAELQRLRETQAAEIARQREEGERIEAEQARERERIREAEVAEMVRKAAAERAEKAALLEAEERERARQAGIAAAAEAEAARQKAAADSAAAAAAEATRLVEEEEEANRLAEEEALAVRLRAERERAEAAERDREARLARREAERAAAKAATTTTATEPKPSTTSSVSTASMSEADRALAEHDAERESRLAKLRAERALEEERKERERVQREVEDQKRLEAEAAQAQEQLIAYQQPQQQQVEEEIVYDEATTAAYYAAHDAAAAQGYYTDDGQWVEHTYDPNAQYAYDQYADPNAYAQQAGGDQQQPYYGEYQQGYAQGEYAQDAYSDQGYLDQQAYDQQQQDAGAYGQQAGTAQQEQAPPLPQEHDDAISEASAEISAPQSDAEEF